MRRLLTLFVVLQIAFTIFVSVRVTANGPTPAVATSTVTGFTTGPMPNAVLAVSEFE
jgi:hypothetical protein